MIKKILTVIAAMLLLAYLCVAVVWARDRAQDMPCTGMEVVVTDTAGQRFVTVAEIIKDLDNLPLRASRLSLADIDTYDVARRLLDIDKVESARCVVHTDGSILVEVVPLQPVARIFPIGNGVDGSSYYINKDGKRMRATSRYHMDVPVISGNFSTQWPPERMMPLLRYLDEHPLWDSIVTHIRVESARNVILVPMINGHVINIGDVGNLDDKFSRLELAYRKIIPVKGWEFYDTISVKWDNQIVATKRKKKLPPMVNPEDYLLDQEETDLGTMMADSAPTAN